MNTLERLKRLGIFLLIFLLLGTGTVLAAWDLVSGCIAALQDGTGTETYRLVAEDVRGQIYALGQDEKGYFLVRGDRNGQRLDSKRLEAPTLPTESVPGSIYVNNEGLYFLSLFDTSKDPVELDLYRFAGDEVDLLLTVPTEGDSLQAQLNSVRLTDFYVDTRLAYFGVCRGDTVRFYSTDTENGVEQVGSARQPGLVGAAIWSADDWALFTDKELVWKDRDPASVSGQIVGEMGTFATGLCYLDRASLRMYSANFLDWAPYAYLNLSREGTGYDLDDCTDMAVDSGGSVLLLLEGRRILLDQGESVTDLSEMLHRPDWQCWLILAGLTAGVLLVSLVLWYVVCEVRRLRLPLLVRWGVLTAAVAVLAVTGLARLSAPVAIRTASEREAQEMLSAVARLSMDEGPSALDLTQRIGTSLAHVEGGTYRDAQAAVFERDEDMLWRLVSDSAGRPAGIRGEMCPGFDRDLAQQALTRGSSFGTLGAGDSLRFLYYLSLDGQVLAMDVSGDSLLAHSRAHVFWTVRELAALAILFTALAVAILCRITIGLGR